MNSTMSSVLASVILLTYPEIDARILQAEELEYKMLDLSSLFAFSSFIFIFYIH